MGDNGIIAPFNGSNGDIHMLMFNYWRKIPVRGIVVLAFIVMLAGGDGATGRNAGASAFLGAAAGVAILWQDVPLPSVVVGPYNDPPAVLTSPFTPTFQNLVNQHTVIENLDQWRHVWRRLYHGVPFNPDAVNFDTHFVVLVGGGLQHPYYGFAINDVEETIGEFAQIMQFGEPAQESALAVRIVLTYPGIKPPKMDFEWRVVAAAIPREFLGPIIINRQILAAP